MWNRDGRSSALARAQALLSAKRSEATAPEPTDRCQSHGPGAPAYGHTVSVWFLMLLLLIAEMTCTRDLRAISFSQGPEGGSVQNSRFPSNAHILSPDLSDLSSVSSVTEHRDTTSTNKQGREVLSTQVLYKIGSNRHSCPLISSVWL